VAGKRKKPEKKMIMDVKNIIHGRGYAHLKILIADDTSANLDLMVAVLSHAGHHVVTVNTGEDAILSFQAERPDVVLMDVMMPGIGGIEATRRIRALAPDHWVPIIFISALNHRDDMVLGLEAGGDDYLGKPIDVVLLLAKINATQRIVELEDRLRLSNAQLKAYRDHSERELGMARDLMEQMVAVSSMQLPGVELWLKPAANLGGDLLITQQFNQERDYILLADAMGHGLSAAFPLVPLVQVFSDIARSGKSVPMLVREMNARLSTLLPVGNFVAVTLISVDRRHRFIEIWNGGNPPVLLGTGLGKVTKKFKSRHLSLGILRSDDFDDSTETFQWKGECCLTLYSDGLADAISADGIEFGEKGIIDALQRSCSHQSLKSAILAHIGEHGASDDISLATIKLQ
jgi:CheY-like chemotaxis protein